MAPLWSVVLRNLMSIAHGGGRVFFIYFVFCLFGLIINNKKNSSRWTIQTNKIARAYFLLTSTQAPFEIALAYFRDASEQSEIKFGVASVMPVGQFTQGYSPMSKKRKVNFFY